MPDRPLTVLTYAASASLAAVALVYFFNPNYLIDGDSSSTSANSRKKGVVGLFNPANDCFINCVLQSLAGLGDLRLFLIRETHRRELNHDIYTLAPIQDAGGEPVNLPKVLSLQAGEVTKGLKDMIDRLNERPIYKKTISASSFIRVLEHAFGTRIAKSQQDAQELLQIIAERLSEEYHAGKEVRQRAARHGHVLNDRPRHAASDTNQLTPESAAQETQTEEGSDDLAGGEDGVPLEGQTETRIECQFCHFIPKTKPTSFVMLTLSVPQKSSTSLNECFDGHFKTEYIDDYKCDRCRLAHACEVLEKDLSRATSEQRRSLMERDLSKLRKAIEEDPEKIPEGVNLPDTKDAPKRKIGRYTEITRFPKILIIHLSRSIFDPRSSSTKNMSKVAFPEQFPVGSLLSRRNYKLLGMVCHKGTHNNGHYETFRRQHAYAPTSNPHHDRSSGPYGVVSTPCPSNEVTPNLLSKADPLDQDTKRTRSTVDSSPSTFSSSLSPKLNFESPLSSRPSSGSTAAASATQRTSTLSPGKPSSSSNHTRQSSFSTYIGGKSLSSEASRFKRRRRLADRWWRISDDKIKECKTNDVLNMQREVYMLFYEVEKEDTSR